MNNIEFNYILNLICIKYEFNENYVFLRSRKKEIIEMKFIFIFLALSLKNYTLQNVIDYIFYKSGNKFNHASLIHGRNQIQNRADIYPSFKKELDSFILEIKNQNFPSKNYVPIFNAPINIVVQDVDLLRMTKINTINVIN